MKKLIEIQKELKAPKSNYNSFGKFSYRSCEDILEAVKPLCAKHGCVLTLSDEVVSVGERYYIKATAAITDTGTAETVEVSALAREAESKKGMDDSQVTGTASSYARKYALNGLFCIDDTKDADTDENTKQRNAANTEKITPFQADEIEQLCDAARKDVTNLCKYYKVKELADLTLEQYKDAKRLLTPTKK